MAWINRPLKQKPSNFELPKSTIHPNRTQNPFTGTIVYIEKYKQSYSEQNILGSFENEWIGAWMSFLYYSI